MLFYFTKLIAQYAAGQKPHCITLISVEQGKWSACMVMLLCLQISQLSMHASCPSLFSTILVSWKEPI